MNHHQRDHFHPRPEFGAVKYEDVRGGTKLPRGSRFRQGPEEFVAGVRVLAQLPTERSTCTVERASPASNEPVTERAPCAVGVGDPQCLLGRLSEGGVICSDYFGLPARSAEISCWSPFEANKNWFLTRGHSHDSDGFPAAGPYLTTNDNK
jgi:hypothetical protein